MSLFFNDKCTLSVVRCVHCSFPSSVHGDRPDDRRLQARGEVIKLPTFDPDILPLVGQGFWKVHWLVINVSESDWFAQFLTSLTQCPGHRKNLAGIIVDYDRANSPPWSLMSIRSISTPAVCSRWTFVRVRIREALTLVRSTRDASLEFACFVPHCYANGTLGRHLYRYLNHCLIQSRNFRSGNATQAVVSLCLVLS